MFSVINCHDFFTVFQSPKKAELYIKLKKEKILRLIIFIFSYTFWPKESCLIICCHTVVIPNYEKNEYYTCYL